MFRITVTVLICHRHKLVELNEICIVQKSVGIKETVAVSEICTLKYCE
jgi:hypothetical protein